MRRSKRLKAKSDTNLNELRQFLGIQIIMGIYTFSRIEMLKLKLNEVLK